MNRITDEDITRLNERQAGLVWSVTFGFASFELECERIKSIGCCSKLGFRIDGREFLTVDDNRNLPALGWLPEARILEFRREVDESGNQVLVIAIEGGNEILMWVDSPEHECITIELERHEDEIQMMIF